MLSHTFLRKDYKSPYQTKLNLVALMDIFTILVFFLLLSHGDSRNIEDVKFVSLPNSSTGVSPHEDLKIYIGDEEIWLNDDVVADTNDVLTNPKKHLQALADALDANTAKRKELTAFEKNNGLAITILGDKEVSYSLLKSVMATCRLKDYRNISLAVNRVVGAVYEPTGLSSGAAN